MKTDEVDFFADFVKKVSSVVRKKRKLSAFFKCSYAWGIHDKYLLQSVANNLKSLSEFEEKRLKICTAKSIHEITDLVESSTDSEKSRLLMDAVGFNQSKKIVHFLITKGADVNAKDKDGWTPLRYVLKNNFKLAKLLIKHGADAAIEDIDGMSFCEEFDLTKENVSFILKHSPTKEIIDKIWEEATHNILVKDECPLSVFEMLLDAGADVNAKQEYTFDTALMIACYYPNKYGRQLFDILIKAGADINATDKYGMTALHHAHIGWGHEFCEFLLKLGADPYIKDKHGRSFADLVGKDMVEFLLR